MVFIGKGEGTNPMVILMAIVLFVLLLAAIVLVIFGLRTFITAKESKEELDQNGKEQKVT